MDGQLRAQVVIAGELGFARAGAVQIFTPPLRQSARRARHNLQARHVPWHCAERNVGRAQRRRSSRRSYRAPAACQISRLQHLWQREWHQNLSLRRNLRTVRACLLSERRRVAGGQHQPKIQLLRNKSRHLHREPQLVCLPCRVEKKSSGGKVSALEASPRPAAAAASERMKNIILCQCALPRASGSVGHIDESQT